ncbi:reprolysin-like metallopeptidase [Hyphobacterium sp.]|uniref:reprolysin-like metallopeptidase n=1 Tax=Hyphobacterium sp. TaxID=2004662 RepID=UPI003B5233DD
MTGWLALLLTAVFAAPAALAQPGLLTPDPRETSAFSGLSDGARDLALGEQVTLALPSGARHDIVLDRMDDATSPSRVWVGHLAEYGQQYRVLITQGPVSVFGYAATPSGAWRLAPERAGGPSVWLPETGVIDEPGSDALSPPQPAITLPEFAFDGERMARAVAAGSNGMIDIAIVYTDGMISLYGLGLMTRLQHLVNVLDQALIDSDTGLRARLVGATRVPGTWNEYTSTLESIDDLFAGASFGHPGSEPDVAGGECSNGPNGCVNDGDLSSLLEWRNALGADIVVMLRRYWRAQQTYCGVAYVPGFGGEGEVDPDEDWILGIAVSGDGPDGNGTPANCGDLTFAHEVGHNLGSTHNVENTTSPAVFDFSYGHRVDCDMRTIMAYDSSRSGVTCSGSYPNETWLVRFSNPEQDNCFGKACGVGAGSVQTPGSPNDDITTPTDNARSMREAGYNVRDYRPTGLTVRSAILPYSRTVASGSPATAFVSIANPASTGSTAENCGLELHGAALGQFSVRPTDPATNEPVGAVGERVDIPAGEIRTFVVSLRRGLTESYDDLRIDTVCSNRAPAPSIAGVNTFRFTSTSLSLPDVVALAATTANNGLVELPAGGGASAFSVASINLRSIGTIVVTPEAAFGIAALETLEICRTNAESGACETARAASQSLLLGTDETATFAVFLRSNNDIANDPARNRVFVHFRTPGGHSVGATSVAVRTAAQ